MAVRFSTPYYLAGEQKGRYHRNQAEHAAIGAGGAALGAYALHKHGNYTLHHALSPHQSSQALKYAAAGMGGYAAFHAARATRYAYKARQKRQRGGNISGKAKKTAR